MTRRARLIIEYGLIWLGLPAALAISRLWFDWPLIPALWAMALIFTIVLLFDRSFDRRQLWNRKPVRSHIGPILLRWALISPVIFVAAWWLTPDLFLGFVRERPRIWAIVMVAYPIASVYPQGIIYRAFMLHRYRSLGRQGTVIVLAALAFAWTHVVFWNFVAPSLTLVGGVLFARTHLRSQSLLTSSIEHALYGCVVFTAGWGHFIFHGSIDAVRTALGIQ